MSRITPRQPGAEAAATAGSGIISVAARSIVVLLPPGAEATAVHDVLRERGLVVHPCASARDAEHVRSVARFAVLDVGLPGALELLRRAAAPPERTLALAVLEPGAPEGAALAAGATSTLHRPIEPRTVDLVVGRLHEQLELRARAEELMER